MNFVIIEANNPDGMTFSEFKAAIARAEAIGIQDGNVIKVDTVFKGIDFNAKGSLIKRVYLPLA